MTARASSLKAAMPDLQRHTEPVLEQPAPPRRQPGEARARTQRARVPGPIAQSRRPTLSWGAWVVGLGVAAALVAGWLHGDAWGLTPGRGVAYWLGIAGGLTILAVLAYPLRKYWRVLRNTGTVAGWFRAHMLLGIIGPAIILFHANFHLGALNSNVALITMLCVAGSGIVGRYLYGKIHYGLHGRRAELSEMISHAADMRATLGGDLPGNSPMWSELVRLEAKARQSSRGILGAMVQSVSLAQRANLARSRVARDARRFIDAECKRLGLPRKQRIAWLRAARLHLDAYFHAVKRAARLILYERLFGLWHVLHVPIFVVMAMSVVVHIVAVHFY